jgi:deoxyribodipyrimidine photo-lyase
MKGLFIFRRDLRVEDNIGLAKACRECDSVVCLFVLDVVQIENNKYFSHNAFAFMLESLMELATTIPIVIEYGAVDQVVKDLVEKFRIDKVYANADYTPYALKRDAKLDLDLSTDVCLNSPLDIKPYKVFTPYYNVASKIKVKPVVKPDLSRVIKVAHRSVNLTKMLKSLKDVKLRQKGGRTAGLKLLNGLHYENRDYMSDGKTSRLSPYIKFGVIGIREVYRKSPNEMFTRQLYWRDFYLQIAYHFPHVFGDNFRGETKWTNDKKLFKSWCDGTTGIPIVDAAMGELNTTGYMHNRCRMITANVLTRLFRIDWRHGERYFATKLTDYDPSSNNGGWQWASGTGADAQPWYRVFNPYTQAEKYDPECKYIKKYAPKYQNMTCKEIFSLRTFDYETARKRAISRL